jgi:hypothetical protein
MYEYRGRLDRCVDGDTVDLFVELGFFITTHQRFRLEHVDTPERGEKKFNKATKLLERLIEEQTDEDGYFRFSSIKTDKYGRWLLNARPLTSIMAVQYPYDNELIGTMSRLRKAIRKCEASELSSYEHDFEHDFYDDILEDITNYGEEYFLERFIL